MERGTYPIVSRASIQLCVPSPRISARGLALVAFVALYLSWQLAHWIPLRQEIVGGATLLAMAAVAAWAALSASRRAQSSPQTRRAWRWIALAVTAQVAGGVAQLAYQSAHLYGHPTLADPLYLAFYPMLLVGILSFPSERLGGRQLLALSVDSAIVMLGGGAAFVYLVLGPEVVIAHSALETLVAIAYPLGDLMLLVALGATLMRRPCPQVARSLWPITVAVASFAIADLIYGFIALHGVYRVGDWVDTLYLLAFVSFLLAANRQRPDAEDGPPRAPRRAETSRSWLPYLSIAASVVVLITHENGRPFFPDMSVAIVLALTATLAVVRQVIFQGNLRRSRARLAHAQEIAQLGSWEWDAEHDLMLRSDVDMRLFGLDPSSPPMSLREAIAAVHPDDRERVDQLIRKALVDGERAAYEMRIVRPDGEVRTIFTRAELHRHRGRVVSVVGTHQDVTERKEMEGQLRYQADHDPLTGLYNRRRFGEELERVLAYATRYRRKGALVVVDLDDFKCVNDTRGHSAGDAALKVLGETIAARVRLTDVVGRLGGDEFVILLPEVDEEQARAVAHDIRVNLAARRIEPPLRMSAGVVLFGHERDLNADDALIAADIALYEAKQNGKDQVAVYRGSAGAAMTWVDRIQTALVDGRFVLYAQPILDLHSNAVAHHELLIRMLGEDGEVVPPAAFLPTAERFGLINAIDRWVTREALQHARDGLRVSINLTTSSIGDAEILAALGDALADGVRPEDVMFEITETGAMRNMDEARRFTEALIALGCDVALDDFGTGFGSFTYLKHLPARYLKIDMEFVREMVANPTDRQVVDSITKVAHSLGKLTIAEGVEDAATLAALRRFGVDRAQGYHIGRPRRISPPTPFERGEGQDRQLAGAPGRTGRRPEPEAR